MESANIIVSQAQPSQFDSIYVLLESARQWLIERGITRQWPTPIPSDLLRERIGSDVVYVAMVNGMLAGTFTLLWEDTDTWGEQPPTARYLHSLAINRAMAGNGLGMFLLRQAEPIVAKAGRQYLRLDCWAENATLCRYYESAGFVSRGFKTWPAVEELHLSEFTVQRYERTVN